MREYYFTGGEPFMNRDMLPILEATLRQGPATVLTNGMLLRPEVCRRLRELFDASEYSLDIRVSLDGFDRESHDAIRGKGVWDRVMIGLRNLADVGTESGDHRDHRGGRRGQRGRAHALSGDDPRVRLRPPATESAVAVPHRRGGDSARAPTKTGSASPASR